MILKVRVNGYYVIIVKATQNLFIITSYRLGYALPICVVLEVQYNLIVNYETSNNYNTEEKIIRAVLASMKGIDRVDINVIGRYAIIKHW